MMLEVNFIDGVLIAKLGERVVLHQPYRATETGIQKEWESEIEAMTWWDTVKEQFESLTEKPVISQNNESALNGGSEPTGTE